VPNRSEILAESFLAYNKTPEMVDSSLKLLRTRFLTCPPLPIVLIVPAYAHSNTPRTHPKHTSFAIELNSVLIVEVSGV